MLGSLCMLQPGGTAHNAQVRLPALYITLRMQGQHACITLHAVFGIMTPPPLPPRSLFRTSINNRCWWRHRFQPPCRLVVHL